MSIGHRYNNGKPRMDLIPPEALLALGQVFTYGTQKYSDRDWEQGQDWGWLYGAAQRHLLAFWGGEETDPESGLPHLAHAAWNVLALLVMSNRRRDLDSRSDWSKKREAPCPGGFGA